MLRGDGIGVLLRRRRAESERRSRSRHIGPHTVAPFWSISRAAERSAVIGQEQTYGRGGALRAVTIRTTNAPRICDPPGGGVDGEGNDMKD
jgi:hypothetical protein